MVMPTLAIVVRTLAVRASFEARQADGVRRAEAGQPAHTWTTTTTGSPSL